MREKTKEAEDYLPSNTRVVERLQVEVASLKDELDGLDAKITTRVWSKMMYQSVMHHTLSQKRNENIDLYQKCVDPMNDLIDAEKASRATAESSLADAPKDEDINISSTAFITSGPQENNRMETKTVSEALACDKLTYDLAA